MSFLNDLREKSWLYSSSDADIEHMEEGNYTPGKTALKFFLIVVSM